MIAETRLTAADLVSPIFVTDDSRLAGPIDSMPGVSRLAVEDVRAEGERLLELGIPATIVFGVPDPGKKNPEGTESHSPDGAVQRAVRELKAEVPGLVVITD